MQKIAFIINSTISKFASRKKDIEKVFQEELFQISFYLSEKSRHIEELTQTAILDVHDYIIFVGGDGTLNEGVNGVLSYCKNKEKNDLSSYDFEQLKHIKVGILPFGSGNDFAKTIHATKSIQELKEKILIGKSKPIDVAYAQFLNEEKKESSRFYINITDVGMGGVVAKKIINKNNAFSADFIYIKSIFSTLLTHKNSKVRYTSEKETWESDIMSLIFANGRFFGSGLGVSPDASITDGVLNIIKLGNINVLDYIYHLKDLKRSKHIKHPEVTYSTAKKLSVEALDGKELLIDMDGEFVGYAPLKIECLSQVLNMIV